MGILELGTQKPVDSWSLLDSQLSLISELQDNERPCEKKKTKLIKSKSEQHLRNNI